MQNVKKEKEQEKRKYFQTILTKMLQTKVKAAKTIRDLMAETTGKMVGEVEQEKSENIARMFFKNFNSLSVFVKGKNRKTRYRG